MDYIEFARLPLLCLFALVVGCFGAVLRPYSFPLRKQFTSVFSFSHVDEVNPDVWNRGSEIRVFREALVEILQAVYEICPVSLISCLLKVSRRDKIYLFKAYTLRPQNPSFLWLFFQMVEL